MASSIGKIRAKWAAAPLTKEHVQHLIYVREEVHSCYFWHRCQSCNRVIASKATIVAKYTSSYTCDWTAQRARQTGSKCLCWQLIYRSCAQRHQEAAPWLMQVLWLMQVYSCVSKTYLYHNYSNQADLELFKVHFKWSQSHKVTAICKADWPLPSHASCGPLTVPRMAGLNC